MKNLIKIDDKILPLTIVQPKPPLTNHGENPDYLQTQLITYIGNKRALLKFIASGFDLARHELKQEKLVILDLFSGTGVVARMAKQYASHIIANDLESYSRITNACYLTNKSQISLAELQDTLKYLKDYIKNNWAQGFITQLYSPAIEKNINITDRAFYTNRNAIYLDTACQAIATLPQSLRKYFLGLCYRKRPFTLIHQGFLRAFIKTRTV